VEQLEAQLEEQGIPCLKDQDHLQIMAIITVIIQGSVADSDSFEIFSMQSQLRLRNLNDLKEDQGMNLIPGG
jgi:hypothetical protein